MPEASGWGYTRRAIHMPGGAIVDWQRMPVSTAGSTPQLNCKLPVAEEGK